MERKQEGNIVFPVEFNRPSKKEEAQAKRKDRLDGFFKKPGLASWTPILGWILSLVMGSLSVATRLDSTSIVIRILTPLIIVLLLTSFIIWIIYACIVNKYEERCKKDINTYRRTKRLFSFFISGILLVIALSVICIVFAALPKKIIEPKPTPVPTIAPTPVPPPTSTPTLSPEPTPTPKVTAIIVPTEAPYVVGTLFHGGQGAKFAVDQKPTTCAWIQKNDENTPSMTIDFGKDYTITKFTIINGCPETHRETRAAADAIRITLYDVSGTSLYEETYNKANGFLNPRCDAVATPYEEQEFTFPQPVCNVRKVKVEILSGSHGTNHSCEWIALTEFTLYGYQNP